MTTDTVKTPSAPTALLTRQQIDFLLSGIRPIRIGKDGKGFAHVEAWDIRRHLLRVFGFGGYDTDQQEMTLVSQIEHPPANPKGKSRWTVIYRATVILTVKIGGIELGHWHGTAAGDATNQPSLADAHDLAMKTADSQAFKRAAVNMGDQFGLSLYNDGALEPVVLRSLAYMGEPVSQQEDAPVKPEPTQQLPQAVQAEPASQAEAPQQAARQRDFVVEARTAADADAVRAIWQDAKAAGLDAERLGHIAAVGKSLAAGPPPPKPETTETDGGEVVPSAEEQEAQAAEAELRAFAEQQGLDDIERDFETAKGMPLEQAIAPQIRAFLAELGASQAAAS